MLPSVVGIAMHTDISVAVGIPGDEYFCKTWLTTETRIVL